MKRTLIYIFFLVIVSLFATELIARIIFPKYSDDEVFFRRAFNKLLNSLVVYDENSKNYNKKFGFCLSPNSEQTYKTDEFNYTVKTNSLGFRTGEIQPELNGEYRVLLVGDSMFWGAGVEETGMISSYMTTMAENRDDYEKKKLTVYNFSVVGYNTVQELLVAKTYINLVKPDQIILGFFVGNDIIPNALFSLDGEDNIIQNTQHLKKMKNELKERFPVLFKSTLFRIIAFRIYIPRLRYQIASRKDIINESYKLLEKFKKIADSHSAAFSVVIMYPKDSLTAGISETWWQSRKPGHLIQNYCKQNSINYLNLIDYIKGSENKKKLFYQRDGHLNQQGNFEVAKVLFKYLISPSL